MQSTLYAVRPCGLSVCPSVTRVGQSKTVYAQDYALFTIQQPHPFSFGVTFRLEILTGSLFARASNRCGVGKAKLLL